MLFLYWFTTASLGPTLLKTCAIYMAMLYRLSSLNEEDETVVGIKKRLKVFNWKPDAEHACGQLPARKTFQKGKKRGGPGQQRPLLVKLTWICLSCWLCNLIIGCRLEMMCFRVQLILFPTIALKRYKSQLQLISCILLCRHLMWAHLFLL